MSGFAHKSDLVRMATPTWTTPNNGAWAYRYTGDTELASPLRHENLLIYTATADGAGTVNAVDLATRKIAWSAKVAKGIHATPAYNGVVLYVPDNSGTISYIEAKSGLLLGQFATSAAIAVQPLYIESPLLPGAHLAFGNASGTFYVLAIGGTPTYTFRTFQGNFTRAVIAGSLLVFAVSTTDTAHIYALDLATGAKVYDVAFDNAIVSGGAAAGNVAFFGCQNGAFLGFDTTSGEITTILNTNSAIVGTAACDSDYVYVGSTNGAFYATPLRDDPSLAAWQLPVTESIITGITIYGGLAYFGGMASSKTTAMFTLDLSQASEQSASVTIDQLQGKVADTPFVDDTYAIFTDAGEGAGTLYAIERQLESVIDRLSFSSQILPRDYAGQSSPKDAAFQMLVSVVDANRVPMKDVAVWITASEETAIEVNGVKVSVSDTKEYKVLTNQYGQIEIDADATDIGMPSLLFRAEFFPDNTKVQFFPDEAMLNKLCTVQPDALGDAKDFDGRYVITDTYRQDDNKLSAIANAISNTVGRQQNTSTSRIKENSATRSLEPGQVAHFTIDIDQNSYVFNPNPATSLTATGIHIKHGGGFDEFKNKVAHGVQKLRHAEWKFDDAAHVIAHAIDDAEKDVVYEYEFDIKEIEKAIQVVRALIKEIVTDVKLFMQWLSELLDWQAYVDMQKKIAGTYEDMLARFKQYFADPANAAAIKTFLTSLGDPTETFLKQANSLTDTTGSQSQSAGSSQDVFRPNGRNIIPQTNWLIKKVRKDIEDLLGPTTDAEKALIAATETFVDAVRDALTDELKALFEEIWKDFMELFQKPGGFLAQLVSTVLDIFKTIVNAGIELAIALVEPAFTYIGALLDILDRMFKQDFKDSTIADLYKLLTGETMTPLGIMTLILAVPTHLIVATLDLTKTAGPTLTTKDTDIALAVTYGILGVLWTVQSAVEVPSVIDFAGCVLYNIAIYFQAREMMLEHDLAVQDWIFWSTQLLPAALGGYQWAIRENTELVASAKKWAPNAYFAMGTGFGIMSTIWAAAWPDDYYGKDGLVLDSNLMGNYPLFAPRAALEYPTAAVLMTAIGYGGASAISITEAVEE